MQIVRRTGGEKKPTNFFPPQFREREPTSPARHIAEPRALLPPPPSQTHLLFLQPDPSPDPEAEAGRPPPEASWRRSSPPRPRGEPTLPYVSHAAPASPTESDPPRFPGAASGIRLRRRQPRRRGLAGKAGNVFTRWQRPGGLKCCVSIGPCCEKVRVSTPTAIGRKRASCEWSLRRPFPLLSPLKAIPHPPPPPTHT